MSNSKLEFSRGEIIASKYEVIDLLDESPLGLTYRVKHLKSNKFVRLTMLRPKIVNRETKDQLVASFKAAKELQHPHLIKVGELGEHDGVGYYTMEDFEGSTLRELLQEYKIQGRQLALKEAAQITIQILEALQVAHDGGRVMRALRPEYVLVHTRYTGPRKQNFVAQTKIVGACFFDLVPAGTLAEDEFTRGEAQYLAPELKSFEPTPTARGDIYSASVIFYEMLTGTAPVGTFQLPTQLRPDLPKHVNDIIELGLANAPEDRYQSASDLRNDIQRLFQDAAVEEEERKPMIGLVGWAAALLLIVAVAAVLFQLQTDPVKEAEVKDAAIRAEVLEAHPKPADEEIRAILAKHPENMALVPAGPYVSGRLHAEFQARTTEPLAEVVEMEGFLIDRFEYPNKLNARPKHSVSYDEAEALCQEQGKRLCTEREWEKACKGPANFVYSYGDTYDGEFCGPGIEDRGYPSGNRTECKSGWGVFDVSGSFREWTSSAPTSSKDTRRIVKGGLRNNPDKGTRCAYQMDESIGYKDSSISFRCCRDLDAPPVGELTADGAGAETGDAAGDAKP